MRSHKNHVALWPAARSSKILNSSPKTHVQARPTTHAGHGGFSRVEICDRPRHTSMSPHTDGVQVRVRVWFSAVVCCSNILRFQHTRNQSVGERASCQNARRFVSVCTVLHAAGSAGPTVLASRWRAAAAANRCAPSNRPGAAGVARKPTASNPGEERQQVRGSRQGSGNRKMAKTGRQMQSPQARSLFRSPSR